METEGKGMSELYRNSSEELFLKTLMETSMGMPVPTMEMVGFKNLSQNFRTDSEELFKSWLTNEENHGYNPSNVAHRTRLASRRMPAEISNLSAQQNGSTLQKKKSNDLLPSSSSQIGNNNTMAVDTSGDLHEQTLSNAVARNMQASNLYLAKAWFNSSQPMTRSRSSELRRKYAAMQTSQTTFCIEAMQNNALSLNNNSHIKQEYEHSNCFGNLPSNMHTEIGNHLETFMSPSNSSSANFNNTTTSSQQMGNADQVLSVVNMLKGTLERKKLSIPSEKEPFEDISSNAMHHTQKQRTPNSNFHQGKANNDMSGIFRREVSQANHGHHMDLDLEDFVNATPTNPAVHISRETSQSESSAAAPVVSSGFNACDDLNNTALNLSNICESSGKQVENSTKVKDFRERIIDNLKDDKKRGVAPYGSVSSTNSGDKGDSTKKRRVERSRKMAEAKERSQTPATPSDMQSVLKRCEMLEKEVRSLKLNLSFMNRKDSEQTKQIEELQKQNEDLVDEKERLLEEIDRILSDTAKAR